ncbi:hypothetical protein K432DRAFT_383675 [Lepidopterella palustris CBS 459.81]|uniref:Uncharacterized protein n=1 Tax=Lepidopterella palustris CBS 459.81 TaxID=1314670 RepID=A0A8E2E7P8_9PEZI|nr:hypothetical protein K432DRAFT_383675 [Lepidopterella palustris CBS 459.81]
MAPNAGAKRHAHYPSFPFHAIRFFQFTSALAVVVLTYYLNIHPAPDDPHMPKVFPLIFIHHGPNKTHEPWFWVMV